MTAPSPTDHPDVDVVVATHARPELVRRTLEAIGAQRYPGRIRTVVVHDREPVDPTLADTTPDRSVVVMANDRRPGLAGSRNCGVLAGHAPLVAFCDDDDTWRPDKLRRQVETLGTSAAPTVVTGIEIGFRGTRTVRVPTADELTVPVLVRRRVMAAHPSTVLVRREALLGPIGLVDESIPGGYGEDYDWMLRAAEHGGVAVVPAPLVDVRWGGSQFARDWAVIVEALEHLLAKHPAFARDRRALGRIRGQQAFAMAAMRAPGGLRAAVRTLGIAPGERRGYLATAVALHLLSPDRVLDLANRHGRGI